MINRFTLSKNPTGKSHVHILTQAAILRYNSLPFRSITKCSPSIADALDVGTWSGLEIYIGIICACLPNFNSLLKPVYAWMGSRTQSPHTAGTTSGGGSGFHSRVHKDEQSGLGQTIRATTVIEIEEHGSHGHHMSNASSDGLIGQGSAVGSVQEIELGIIGTSNTTCGRAWS